MRIALACLGVVGVACGRMGFEESADPAAALVSNGDFESPGPGCGPNWSPVFSAMTRSTVAYAGSSSCRMCRTEPGSDKFDAVTIQSMPIDPGATRCTVTVFIRSSPTDAAGATIRLGIDWHDSTGVYLFDDGRNDAPYTSSFEEFAHGADIPANATSANVFVGGNGSQDDCVLVDQVSLSCE